MLTSKRVIGMVLAWLPSNIDSNRRNEAGCRTASSKTTAQRDAIGITVIREASRQGEVEADGKDQQAHQRREEVDSGAISTTQVWPCYHRRPRVENQKARRRTLLVLWQQQTDGCPLHAGVPEMAKRTRKNATGAERRQVAISSRRDGLDLESMCEENAIAHVLGFIESTEMGKGPA